MSAAWQHSTAQAGMCGDHLAEAHISMCLRDHACMLQIHSMQLTSSGLPTMVHMHCMGSVCCSGDPECHSKSAAEQLVCSQTAIPAHAVPVQNTELACIG